MYERIESSIAMYALHTKDNVKPVKFVWNKKDFSVTKVNFQYKSKEAQVTTWNFSVSVMETPQIYKISYNPETLAWTLEEIYFETTPTLNDAKTESNTTYRLR